ncbi:hypothetical protein [Caldibacillus debilis]|uniref:hypothetical protein n=1 Tax=Caldibacillus debilis TaxID=301148 RepID=UPI0023F4636E|nr:hypothetical protein [Caldibacillus debilis]
MKRKYKHKRTGAVVFSSGRIFGENWVEVGEEEKEGLQKSVEGEEKEEYVEEEVNLEQMTKSQLIEFAKEHGIEVNERDTKAVIVDTIAKAFE